MPNKSHSVSLSSKKSSKSKEDEATNLVYYPAYCYSASPTWFRWVKLTAHDVHQRLQIQHDFHNAPTYTATGNGWTQNHPTLLFYLNHPVQFVQLVGVIVSFEEFFEKFWLFTLDDSSGATIEVNCRKPEKDEGKVSASDAAEKEVQKDEEANERVNIVKKLDIGHVVVVKGHVTTFRNVRQIQLDRISLVNDTNEEVRLISARTQFRQEVLLQPWIISPTARRRLQARALGESAADAERKTQRLVVAKKKAEMEKRHADKIFRLYQRDERKRQIEADKARDAGKALQLGR